MKILQTPDSKILLLLFIITLSGYWLLPEPGHKAELKKMDRIYRDSIAHWHTLYIGAMKSANKARIAREEAELRTQQAEQLRDEAHRQRKHQQDRYEKALRNFTRYSPASLDSAVTARYGYTR